VRVLLTGTRGEELASILRSEGFEVLERPLIRIEPLPGPPLRANGYDWVVVTSRNGVEELLRRLEGALPRVAAIGPGTAAALRERGVEPALVAGRPTQEGLVAEFPRLGGRVLFLGAEGSRDLLVRELEADFVPLYRTVELRPGAVPDADLVVLASASSARALSALRTDLPCVTIGPVTTEEARRLGLEVVAEARSPNAEGLASAVKLAGSQSPSSPS
jgi:uroporphyrinogen-III synthase